MVSGGFLFQLLERHASIQKCEEGQGYDKRNTKKLANLIFNYVWLNISTFDSYPGELNSTHVEKLNLYLESRQNFTKNYNKDIHEMLVEFAKKSNQNYNVFKYRGQDCIKDTSWIIESSLLFSMSLFTTIGIYRFKFRLKLGIIFILHYLYCIK